MSTRGRRIPGLLLVAASLLPPLYLLGQVEDSSGARSGLLASAALSVLGYLGTIYVLPTFTPFLSRSGLTGRDLCKKGTASADKNIPEGTGVIAGTMFLVCVVVLQLFYARGSTDKMVDYLSALLSICFMTFLGFTDDVLDLPWRYKLLLPTVATLPLLCAYDGSTSIVVPRPLDHLLMAAGGGWEGGGGGFTLVGRAISSVFPVVLPSEAGGMLLLDLGTAYMVYMGMLAVFCTNAVNIYAGINGLEAGQSFVVACAILAHNAHELRCGRETENNTFSAMLLLPFIATTLGLLRYNWYPARVFVGDTYCYFAGMTFAVVGIHGHFSKTLILMFLPQVANFLISVPQLFKVLPCPRHRLPRVDTEKGLLVPSTMPFTGGELPVWRYLRSGPDGEVINLTLINLVLHVSGPMRENVLCTLLLVLQAAACAFGFVVRYYFAGLVYGSPPAA
ncbi:unnamed protein product [Pylaiella littoralis]